MKKIFTLLCVTLFALATMANGVEVNGIYYLLDSNKMTASVTYMGTSFSSGNNYVGDVVIPDTIVYNENKYAVTSIGNRAFYQCSSLTSILIGDSVITIGNQAFEDCNGLISVIIGNSVITIGNQAFEDCNGLISVIIGNSVTTIGSQAFSRCSGLTSVTIPNTVTTIGSHAFHYCSSLLSVTIPNSVTTIGNYAFESCRGLTSPVYNANCFAYMPTSYNGAYSIPDGIKQIAGGAFSGCRGLTSVMIPNSITTIENYAFSGCSGLISVTIPNSVTAIGNYAFYNCKGLTSINVDAANMHYCSVDGVLFNYAKDTLIQYPIGNTRTTYIIPNSVTTIENDAFMGCSGLTSVTIPNSVTTIGWYAFSGCSGLKSVTIPNSVTTIGVWAFYDCSGLTSVTISNSVTTIGDYAFDGCTGLTSVTIPNSVTTIGYYAFDDCNGLISVIIGNSVTTIGSSAFSDCTGLTSITCLAIEPPSLGSNAFNNVPHDIPLYVLASSVPAYQAAAQWNEFDIHWIVVDSVTPDTTQLSWLPVDSASLYKLRIYSEQIELDTTLMIEADSLNGGISIPITLAPNRDRRMPMDDIGSVVIITLEPNSGATKDIPFKVTVSTTSKDKIDILFDMEVLKGEKVFKEESGNFTLNDIRTIVTKTSEIKSSNWSISSGIFDLYGRHYPFLLWNQLPAGIYILREGEKASKVMKR